MSFSINQAILSGNVSQEPVLKYTPSGVAVCNFSMATSHSIKKGDVWENVPTFHRITVWQKMAELVSNGLVKGQQVTVRGRIDNRSYKDATSGETKYISEIVAEDVVFVSPKKQGGNATSTPPAQPTPAPTASGTQNQSAPTGEPHYDESGELMF